MSAENSLISTMSVGLGFAFIGGSIAQRFRLPPLVGYLLAGIAVGPFTPGFVADTHLAPQLAEIGVILLMFGVGMHFSVQRLWKVKWIAVPGAIAQIAAATFLGALAASMWGWPLGQGVVFGLALSVASTVVLLRALEDRGLLSTENGQIAIGWLIVEDLVMVLALVLLPPFSGLLMGETTTGDAALQVSLVSILSTVAVTFLKVGVFVGLMLSFGVRVFPWVLSKIEQTGDRELFTLALITLSLSVAFAAAKLFGVSFALGAFFSGIVIHESKLSSKAERHLAPLQDVFAALFFVSVGMLFDPSVLWEKPMAVATVLAIIVGGKSLAAYAIVLLLGRTVPTALIISAALGQIGEFSFILAELGIARGLLPEESQSLIVAGALISITLNPLLFWLIRHQLASTTIPLTTNQHE